MRHCKASIVAWEAQRRRLTGKPKRVQRSGPWQLDTESGAGIIGTQVEQERSPATLSLARRDRQLVIGLGGSVAWASRLLDPHAFERLVREREANR
ncbi:hypothetical protein GCM10009102_30050 [Sphingomonas insulae]|uniref:Transposase n=1 Tax=Sphingomonas insulae TaxID=424800 RepID=A0ABN1HZM4_9SPHN